MPTYRTNGPWGAGIGVNLTPAQVDTNFYELRTDLDDLIANPPTANSIETIEASGFTWTITLTDGTELPPVAVPVVYTVWRGDWAPLTLYSEADLFRVDGQGIYAVLQAHTSAATFDPDAAAGSPLAPLYNQLIGVATVMGTLGDLSDVTITSVADDDFIAWDAGSSAWTNRTVADVATLIAGQLSLDDLTDVIAPTPLAGQVLRYLGGSPDAGWQPDTLTLDDLGDVAAASPSDGQVLTYQAGSPTGWIAASPAAVPTTLDALTDVVAPSPTNGDVLQFNGTNWVDAAGSAISGLGDATLPLVGTSYMEVSEPSGSPVTYASKKIEVDDLFSDRTIAGTWTLPGSGRITSSGELGIGVSPATLVDIGGTYATAFSNAVRVNTVLVSSVTGTQTGVSLSPDFSPGGASLSFATGVGSTPVISSTAFTLSTFFGSFANISLGAGYSGTVTVGGGYNAGNPTVSGGSIAEYNQYRAVALVHADGLAAGTKTNRNFYAGGITAGAAGGTLNNRALEITVPAGGATAGTTNNRGIYITGNGGTATGSPPGTVNNFALLSDSTAPFQIGGLFQFLGATSSFPALKRSAAELQVRLADDSADAALKSSKLTLSDTTVAVVAGASSGFNGPGGFQQQFQFYGSPGFLLGRHSADANGANFNLSKSRNATVGSHTAVQAADIIGRLTFSGSDGSAYVAAARIEITARGTISSGVVQGEIDFNNLSAAGVVNNRLKIYADGDVRQGNGNALVTTATDGFLLISTCAGPPTGIPTNAGASAIPIVYDKTNNRIYAYNGGWRMVAVA